SCANTASRRPRRAPDAARCSARRASPARCAVRPTRRFCPSSAPPPAKRCGAAAPAASRSIISSATNLDRIGASMSATATLIEPAAAGAGPRFHWVRVAGVQRETPEAISVTFNIPDELASLYAFRAGQYLTLRTTLDGEEVRRS